MKVSLKIEHKNSPFFISTNIDIQFFPFSTGKKNEEELFCSISNDTVAAAVFVVVVVVVAAAVAAVTNTENRYIKLYVFFF